MSEQFLEADVMAAQELFTVSLGPNPLEWWGDESTTSPLRVLAVRLHSTGISIRETAAALEQFSVIRSPSGGMAVGSPHWGECTRPASGDAVAGRCRRHCSKHRHSPAWLYAAIDVDTSYCSTRSSQNGPEPTLLSSFSAHWQKHDFSETTFLVDGMGYLTALARCDLRGHLDYVERNLIETWVQTLAMRVGRFQQTWMGASPSAQRWLTAFGYYYNFQRPNQALDNCTPVEEVKNS